MDPGFLELKTAQQLFAKLEEDFKRANDDTLNPHAWFNFFVTAEHLPEWHFKDSRLAADFRQKEAILRTCSHIANGGKHFVLKDKMHKSIASTNYTYDVVAIPPGWATQSEGPTLQMEKAYSLQLSVEEAKELGNEILIVDLAKWILTFYRKFLSIT